MNEETYAKRMVERCSEMIVNALQNMSIEDINMYQLGYEKGRADAIDEVYKAIEPYIQDINTNKIWAHIHNERSIFDWLVSWKNALYRDLEQLKEQNK